MTRRQVSFIVIAGLGGFAGLLYLMFRIGPLGEPSVSPLGQRSGMPRGRPGQGIARANQLHRTHVTAAVTCGSCHRRDAPSAAAVEDAPAHRCLSCHGERGTGVHLAVADADARECLSCHDFLHLPAASLSLWGCPSCHVTADTSDAPRRIGTGPVVVVHRGVFCGDCHAPHATEPIQPKPCVQCHEPQATAHGERVAKGAAACLTCHRAHEPAAAQRATCAECHREDVGAGALFTGHDSCAGCHVAHGFTRDTARPCGECHEDRVPARRRHKRCVDCHRPHEPLRGLQTRCVDCHRANKSSHPADARGACLGCHPPHEKRGAAAVGIATCSSCHRKMRSDTALHNGARCSDCHRPHGKLTGDYSAAFCLSCHRERVGKAQAIAVGKQHAACGKCHVRAAHDTSKPPAGCASCHKSEGREVMKGHRDCSKCHETHTTEIRRGAECTDCHPRKQIDDRHRRDGYARCTMCHHPHTGRTKKR